MRRYAAQNVNNMFIYAKHFPLIRTRLMHRDSDNKSII